MPDERNERCERCPVCSREWPSNSEHALAVRKRGKCIGCVLDADEYIEMFPYEFRVGDHTPKREVKDGH